MTDATIDCWKARAVLPRAKALQAAAALEAIEPMPVVSAFQTGGNDLWEVEAFFPDCPDADDLERLTGQEFRIQAVISQDWVTIALDGLPPVQAGPFFVHGQHGRSKKPVQAIGLEIEASTAFGTGHHGTTRGCLLALTDLIKRQPPAKILDMGCGSGILAFAAAKLTHAPVFATDIDPIAVTKATQSARINAVHPYVKTARADGMNNSIIRGQTRFDLILANILMRPLMRLMPEISRNLRPGGYAILSGLLSHQDRAVLGVAQSWHLHYKSRVRLEGWVTLTLRKERVIHRSLTRR